MKGEKERDEMRERERWNERKREMKKGRRKWGWKNRSKKEWVAGRKRKKAAVKQTTIAKKKSTVATTPKIDRTSFDRMHVCARVGFEFLISNNTYIRVLFLRGLFSSLLVFPSSSIFVFLGRKRHKQTNNTHALIKTHARNQHDSLLKYTRIPPPSPFEQQECFLALRARNSPPKTIWSPPTDFWCNSSESWTWT